MSRETLDTLESEMLRQIEGMTEAELRAEFEEDGLDFDVETERLRRMMLRACGPPPPPPLREYGGRRAAAQRMRDDLADPWVPAPPSLAPLLFVLVFVLGTFAAMVAVFR